MDYKIKSGDTLSKIARKFGLSSWKQIMNLNPQIKNPNRIFAGQTIKIPNSSKSAKQAKKFFDFSKAPGPKKSKLKNSISMNRVAQIAKRLSGYNNYKRDAKMKGYDLRFEVGAVEGGYWAYMRGKPTPPVCSIKINKKMFLDYGVNQMQEALDFIGELATIYSPGQDPGVEFFKPVMEEFLGAWMSITLTHELRHAFNLYWEVPVGPDGSYNSGEWEEYKQRSDKKGRNYDEEEARQAEAYRTRKSYNYVFSRISEMITRLEDVYGFSAEEQALISGKMIKVWNNCVKETFEWFRTGPSHKYVGVGGDKYNPLIPQRLPPFDPGKLKPIPKKTFLDKYLPNPTYKSLLNKFLPGQQNITNVQREQKGKETKMKNLIYKEIENILKEKFTGKVPNPDEGFQGTYEFDGPSNFPTHVTAVDKETGDMSPRPVKIDYELYKKRGHENWKALAIMYAKGKAALSIVKPPKPREVDRRPPSSARIMKEYIHKNSKENFEETPFGQIVADEVNKAVSEIPEIKLALEFLSEQEDQEIERNTQELGRTYARATLSKVKEEMVSKLPELVDKVLQDLLDGLEFDE